jgi:hypothetical protein
VTYPYCHFNEVTGSRQSPGILEQGNAWAKPQAPELLLMAKGFHDDSLLTM